MGPIETVLASLERQGCQPRKSSGDRWQARCPAHDDKHASLSVSQGDDGKVLLHCHAGCELDEVLAGLNLKERDLFPPKYQSPKPNGAPRSKTPPAPKPLPAAQVEAMAKALSNDVAALKHVSDVLRFSAEVVAELRLGLHVDEKGRRWLAYPHQRAGAWRYANCRSLDGEKTFIRHPAGQKTQLYLTDALEDGGTAILVEGERDAAAALTIRLSAELGGAGGAAVVSMPGAEQIEIAATALATQQLVYLLTDADPQGEKAAEKLSARLGPERCRRVRLDGFKDLGDLLSARGAEKAGGIALEALRRAEAAGPFGSTAKQSSPATRTLLMERADHVRPEPMRWLWFGRVPRGKLTIIEGSPGLGKTQIALDLAARISAATSMPLNLGEAPPDGSRNVIVASYEDDPRDTLRPRLEAAGADLTRVHFVKAVRSNATGDDALLALPDDLDLLEAEIRRVGAALVVVDPLMAALSGAVDSHRDQDVRRALSRLRAVAEDTGVAIVLIRHLRKMPGGSAVHAGQGSIGIAGAARLVHLVAQDPGDPDSRLFAPVKSNLGRMPPTLRFKITEKSVGGIAAPCVDWLGEAPGVDADMLVAPPTEPEERGARAEAAQFLREALADGPKSAKELKKDRS